MTQPVTRSCSSPLLGRERPTRAWLCATALGVVGLGLLTGLGSGPTDPLGVLRSAGAGLAIASFTMAAKRLLARGRGTLEVLAATFCLGALVVVPVTASTGLGWVATPRGGLVAVWLGVGTMALANIAYARGLGHLSAPATATLALTDPLTATLLGVLVLGQSLTPVGWVGVAVLFTGLLVQGGAAGRRRSRSGTSET